MLIKSFKDTILLDSRLDVLRIHLYTKLLQMGIKPFENDIDIILELYSFGGYSNADEQRKFIRICMDKLFKRSDQSLRNTLSKYTTLGVFERIRNSSLKISDRFLPSVECDKLVLQHTVSHAK